MPRFKVPGVRKGFTPSGGGGISDTYDNRFGTDTVTAAATGWFTFGLNAGNRRVWVNSARADDTGNGLSAAAAKKTFGAAWTVFTTGWTSGDQLMIAGTGSRSYSISGVGNSAGKGGISATYPTVFMCYDPADAANSAKYGKLLGADLPVIDIELGNNNVFSMGSDDPGFGQAGNFFLQGLEVRNGSYASGNASIGYTGRHDNVGHQNCKFNGVSTALDAGSSSTGFAQNSNFSKSAYWGAWNPVDGNASGIYLGNCDGAWVQDNVGVRPGFKMGASRTDTTANGAPTAFSHFLYTHAGATGCRTDRCIVIDAGGDAFSMRADSTSTCLVSIDNPSVGSISSYSISYTENPGGSLLDVTDVVAMGVSIISSGTLSTKIGFNTRNGRSGNSLTNMAMFDSGDTVNGYILGWDNLDAASSTYLTVTKLRTYNWGSHFTGVHGPQPSGCHITVTDTIADSDLDGSGGGTIAGVTIHSGSTTFPNAKTRAQVYGALGFTADAATGKAELVNWLLEYPNLAGSFAKAINTIGLQSLGLTPISYTAASVPSLSGLTAPRSIY